MAGFWGSGNRRLLLIVVLLLVIAVLAVCSGTTFSFWSRVITAPNCFISFGTWRPVPTVCKVCPSYGVRGVCSWAVFLYGTNLRLVSKVKLVKGAAVVQATKVWQISDGILYVVFDLRNAAAGTYDIKGITSDGRECLLYKGFVIGSSICGRSSGAIGALRAPTPAPDASTTPENPPDFKVVNRDDDPTAVVAQVNGPLHSRFASASLVAPGTLVDGNVGGESDSGCQAGFGRQEVTPGTYDLLLKRPDDSSLLLEGSVVVQDTAAPPAPMLSGVQPTSGAQGEMVAVTITGVNLQSFDSATIVRNGKVIQAAHPVKAQHAQISCVFNLAGAPPGAYDLVVASADGQKASLPQGFTVLTKPGMTPPEQPAPTFTNPTISRPEPSIAVQPTVVKVTPGCCLTGKRVDLVIDGAGFRPDLRVKLRGETIAWALGYRSITEVRIRCTFDLAGVAPGQYQLVLVGADKSEYPFSEKLVVMPAQRVTSEK